MNESGAEVDSLVMDVALILAVALARKGVILSARVFALLAASSSGYENDHAKGFLSQLDSSPGDQSSAQGGAAAHPSSEPTSRGESVTTRRVSLLKSNKVPLAQDKFDSLRRSAALEPAVLSGLFHCAIWRGDRERQAESALQLSEIESLDEATRCNYRAYHCLISPSDALTIPCKELRFEFEDVEQVEMALIASDRFEQMPSESLSQIQVPEGEVPPRSGFQFSDREIAKDERRVGQRRRRGCCHRNGAGLRTTD